ncbi:uncharacterized protein PHACADRAFT_246481 [Phanerochaete carnosa HHB-10118-sp]|uniref:Uncharacterized protein n=1 Tax=Phanerochaete carnosa (strain HHB-10118-sp) TaxID=650164 RepID=K5W974_PHACS|nr:uncharacterized protein PHACADRAFT_246481 [Phanerochaete carnosa HHB-10118-sp]EKM60493.1 hypothetical protein PHACADRAFT_246481 [Phanerochaete carnosa HHB-10118-sp]
MVGKSFAALLPFAIMLSLVEDAFALRPPFTKRDTSSTPAPSTLPMPLQFDGRGGYQVAVSLVSIAM